MPELDKSRKIIKITIETEEQPNRVKESENKFEELIAPEKFLNQLFQIAYKTFNDFLLNYSNFFQAEIIKITAGIIPGFLVETVEDEPAEHAIFKVPVIIFCRPESIKVTIKVEWHNYSIPSDIGLPLKLHASVDNHSKYNQRICLNNRTIPELANGLFEAIVKVIELIVLDQKGGVDELNEMITKIKKIRSF